MTLTSDQIVSQIIDVVASKKCVVWLGAGMSVQHYPSWPSLIKTLCSECKVTYPPGDDTPDAKVLAELADECKESAESTYHMTLDKTFRGQPKTDDARYHALLQTDFRAFVTTNYDQLLELHKNQRDRRPIKSFAYPDLPAVHLHEKGNRAIYHVHGSILLPNKIDRYETRYIVLSKKDFDRAYGEQSLLPSFLSQLFRYFPIIFLGCRLEEQELQRIFERVEGMLQVIRDFDSSVQNQKRFFITGRREKWEAGNKVGIDTDAEAKEEEHLKKFGIIVLRYEHHDQVLEVLTALRKQGTEKPKLDSAWE